MKISCGCISVLAVSSFSQGSEDLNSLPTEPYPWSQVPPFVGGGAFFYYVTLDVLEVSVPSSNPHSVSVGDKLTSKCQPTPRRSFNFPEPQCPHLKWQQSLPTALWRLNETAELHTEVLKTSSSALCSKMWRAHIECKNIVIWGKD